ncbi:MAG: hypothetical protein E7464_05745 [Ruminococcaceae bacterium]|nr:hypothetical protein [Oscillospiraceae bacterium]
MKSTKKPILKYAVALFLGFVVMLWLFLGIPLQTISSSQNESIARQFLPNFLKPNESFFFQDLKGNMYRHTYRGMLWQYHLGIPVPVGEARKVVPVDDGVAFTRYSDDSKGVFLYQDHRIKKLPEQFTNVCWDGTQLLLWEEESGSIYSYREDLLVPVFQADPSDAFYPQTVFLASERWVVIGMDFDETLVFDREQGKLVTYDLDLMDISCGAFLYQDALFIVVDDQSKDSLTILDLTSGEKTELDIGVGPIGEGNANFSAALNQERSVLYLSVRANWPLYFEVDDQTTTIAIDLKTLSMEKLNDEFYSGLFMKDGKLYGTKPKTGIVVRLQ